MSAECHVCGKDLPYDLICEYCEKSARIAELEAALERVIRESHALADGRLGKALIDARRVLAKRNTEDGD